ncbi:MAG: chlorite dismutase family protein [Chloroflexi bacterium]|nr:chlorite dismutase family protein [Chloroflexota bacterium]
MTDAPWYLHVLALGIDRECRRRPAATRADDWHSFATAEFAAPTAGVASVLYSSIGLQPGVDLLLWGTASSVTALEAAAAHVLRSEMGGWLTVTHSFLGRSGPSQYVSRQTAQEQGMTGTPHRASHLVVYPFTKSANWYLTPREERQAAMTEHMQVGRRYPTVRQALAYSFGLDDQDFVVSYETDDLGAFGDLVRDLRATESRRETVNDTPILLGSLRSLDEIGVMLGAKGEPGS